MPDQIELLTEADKAFLAEMSALDAELVAAMNDITERGRAIIESFAKQVELRIKDPLRTEVDVKPDA